MSEVVSLKLVKTQRSEPVLTVAAREARQCEDGTLIWSGGSYYISTENNADVDRFNVQIGAEHIRSAAGWFQAMKGKGAAKLARKLAKLLKQAEKL